MHRLLILLLFALASTPAVAQQQDVDASDATAATDDDSSDASGPADEIDEIDADEDDPDELYTEDEDRFIPSEDVKFGQSIPFPTDI